MSTPLRFVHEAGGIQESIESTFLYAIDRSEHIRNLTCLYIPPLPRVGSLAGFANHRYFART